MKTNQLNLNQSYQNITFTTPIYQNQSKTNQNQKDDHQNNLSFAYL